MSSLTVPKIHGFLSEFQSSARGSYDKFKALGSAIPDKLFSWRPGPGVYSFAEVFVHVAFWNYRFARRLGTESPVDTGAEREREFTKKDDIMTLLDNSHDHLSRVLKGMGEFDLETQVTMGDRRITMRALLLFIETHAREHLGQLIAYSRMNNITPPWSLEQ